MTAETPPSLSKLLSHVTQFVWPTAPKPVVMPSGAGPAAFPADPIAASGAPESLLKQLGPHKGRTLFLNA